MYLALISFYVFSSVVGPDVILEILQRNYLNLLEHGGTTRLL